MTACDQWRGHVHGGSGPITPSPAQSSNNPLRGLPRQHCAEHGSLALIGDAIHNLGDVFGLALGWGAERLSTRLPSLSFTDGFGRSTQLAALINGVLIAMAAAVVLVGLTGWHWLDPITAIGVGLAVGYTGLVLIRDALIVLLDAIPAHIDPE